VLIWSRVHGFVDLEISHNLPPYGVDPEILYRLILESITGEFIR